MANYSIKTNRLGLRNWQDSDIEKAVNMNFDVSVMEFFPSIMTPEQTIGFIKRMQLHFTAHGFCYFAVDVLETDAFIGFIGLSTQTFESSFTPCVDIGWRLLPSAWGKGYATEGARACLKFAFSRLRLPEVYAIAAELNIKSQRVMRKLGMTAFIRFAHPNIAVENPLRDCVAYRILKNSL